MYNNVLIPTDGSDNVDVVATHGLSIASRCDATIHALHVLKSTPSERKRELTMLPENESSSFAVEAATNAWVSERDSATRQVTDRATRRGLSVNSAVRRGIPARTIRHYANAHEIDLICMRTHERTALERFLFGSVTGGVVRSLPAPVLIVTQTEHRSTDDSKSDNYYQDVLVPISGIEKNRAGRDHGLALARAYDATIHILHIADHSRSSLGEDKLDESVAAFKRDSRQVLERPSETEAAQSDRSVTTAVRYDSPRRSIRNYVVEHDIDLVILGPRKPLGLSRRFFEPPLDRILRTTTAPVLIT
jgi:nucleotide-binding universal stress UspA family protein